MYKVGILNPSVSQYYAGKNKNQMVFSPNIENAIEFELLKDANKKLKELKKSGQHCLFIFKVKYIIINDKKKYLSEISENNDDNLYKFKSEQAYSKVFDTESSAENLVDIINQSGIKVSIKQTGEPLGGLQNC